MRAPAVLAVLAAAGLVALSGTAPASAFGRNPRGCGIYSPDEPPARGRLRWYRYDPRSWCYNLQPTRRPYYPYYGSGYWVPRAAMRYRYRYVYRGPQYTYYPAWGYGYPALDFGW
jgi:hypothetical protein